MLCSSLRRSPFLSRDLYSPHTYTYHLLHKVSLIMLGTVLPSTHVALPRGIAASRSRQPLEHLPHHSIGQSDSLRCPGSDEKSQLHAPAAIAMVTCLINCAVSPAAKQPARLDSPNKWSTMTSPPEAAGVVIRPSCWIKFWARLTVGGLSRSMPSVTFGPFSNSIVMPLAGPAPLLIILLMERVSSRQPRACAVTTAVDTSGALETGPLLYMVTEGASNVNAMRARLR